MDVAWSMNLQPGNGNGIFSIFIFGPGVTAFFQKGLCKRSWPFLQMTASDRCRIICSVSTTNCAAAAIAVFYA